MRHTTEVEPDSGAALLSGPDVAPRVRYAPARELPAYRYVPGSGLPHPVNDPRGHAFTNERPPPHAPWTEHLWPLLEEWKYGVDLYNHWYFWEAHEAWEGLWQVTDKTRPNALFVQGLIQCSAAMLKVHLGSVAGASGLWIGAERRLDVVAGQHREFMGLKTRVVLRRYRSFFAPLKKGALPSLQKGFPVLELEED